MRGTKKIRNVYIFLSIFGALNAFESLPMISSLKMDFFKKFSLRFQNKGSSAAAPLQTKSPLALDSDISAIDGMKKYNSITKQKN